MSTNHLLKNYNKHLEFLGYSVREIDEIIIACCHPRKDDLDLVFLDEYNVMLSMTFVFPDKFLNDLIPLHMYANELNSNFFFLKAHIATNEHRAHRLRLKSVFLGKYSKQNFAIFMNKIEVEMEKFHSYPKTSDMLATEDEVSF